MRRHPKAPAVIGGKSASSGLVACLALLCFLFLIVAPAASAAKFYDSSIGTTSGNPALGLTFGGNGSTTHPTDVAVNDAGINDGNPAANGDIYVVDEGNNRIQRLNANGTFDRAWGADVVQAGKTGDVAGTNPFEICTVASECKAGVAGGGNGSPSGDGAMNRPQGVAVDQDTGNVYVSDRENRRIDEYTADGVFIRSFGFDALATASEIQSATVTAASGSFTLSYGSGGPGVNTTGDIPVGSTAATVQSALNGLTNINGNGGSVTVTGPTAGAYAITFAGTLANTDVPNLIAGASSAGNPLVGGTITTALAQNGSAAGTGYEICGATFVCKAAVGANNVSSSTPGPNPGQFSAGSTANAYRLDVSTPDGNAATGKVYLANTGSRRVEVFNLDGSSPTNFGTQSQFGNGQPIGVAVDAAGIVYATAGNSPDAAAETGSASANAVARYNTANSTFLPILNVEALGAPSTFRAGLEIDRASGDLFIVNNNLASNNTPPGLYEIGTPGTTPKLVGIYPTAFTTPFTPWGVGVDPATGKVYMPTGLQVVVFDNDGISPINATIEAGVTEQTSVELKGTVNPAPNGTTGQSTSYHFEVSEDGGATWSTLGPETQVPPNGDTNFATAVHAQAVRLLPGSVYRGRLVAKRANNTGGAAVETTFTTAPGRPLITEQSASVLGTEGAVMGARIMPAGSPTSYRFEWGRDTSYEHRSPLELDPFIGSGSTPVKVAANLSQLQEDATYHYRVVAANEIGTTTGPDQTFVTNRANSSCPNREIRAEQTSATLPDGSTTLPNCMGLEMVSPARKFNQWAIEGNFSAAGQRILFSSPAALAETPKQLNLIDQYVATRGADGWVTKATQSPSEFPVSGGVCGISPDFSRWTTWASTQAQSGLSATTIGRISADESGFSPLSPLLTPVFPPLSEFNVPLSTCQGGSADGSMMLYGAVRGTAFLQGDPIVPGEATYSVYEGYLEGGTTPAVRLLQRDRNGVVYGGGCGAMVGGKNGTKRGAVSADGSVVYFTTRPGQTGSGTCETAANKLRIMKRTMTGSGPEIETVDTSECNRLAPAPACSSADGDDDYWGASQEGTKVFFTSPRQLTNSDLDTGGTSCPTESTGAPGCDLYLYDSSRPPGSRLTQISAGDGTDATPGNGAEVLGVADIAGDGSRAYFVARGVLTTDRSRFGRIAESGKPNLYMYERDSAHPAGRTVFIGTLAAQDTSVWNGGVNGLRRAVAVPMLGGDPEDQSIGGDGHVLVFYTRAALTPADSDSGRVDIYRYDSLSGALDRISRAAPGGSDGGAFDVSPGGKRQSFLQGGVAQESEGEYGPPPDTALLSRTVSEDGRTIAFVTGEGLSPADTDGQENTYIWRDGSLTPVQGTRVPRVSMSGDQVLFQTGAPLLPQDGDTSVDVYVARMNGGFPTPVTPSVCEGEGCQGPPSAPLAGGSAASEATSGAGNVGPGKPPKKKHKKHHKKHKKHDKKSGQGGQK